MGPEVAVVDLEDVDEDESAVDGGALLCLQHYTLAMLDSDRRHIFRCLPTKCYFCAPLFDGKRHFAYFLLLRKKPNE